MRCITTLLVLLISTAAAQGQEETQIPKKIQKEIRSLVGTWEVSGRIGDEKIEGTWSARPAPGRHCLNRHSTQEADGQTVTGIGVIGWDAATETITEQVFFSNGESALLRWKVEAPGKWEGKVTGFQDGKAKESTATFNMRAPGEVLYEETLDDGTEIEAILKKKPREKKKRSKPKSTN